ncbi:DUF2868 domain-containing protein [Verrucomicrobiota bacterium sgz303538]
MNRSTPWTIADVLDFESLLAADAAVHDDRLRERDHAIFEEKIAPQLQGDAVKDRREVFRQWLEVRRREKAGILPGEAYETGRQTLLAASAITGLFLGASVAIGLLHYSGNEPINAMLFLAWTLGPQWLFLISATLLWIERHTSRFLTRWRPLRALLSGILWLFSTGLRKLPGQQRDALRSAFAGLGPKRDIYAPLVGWPLMVVTQVFAVCFNLGIIGTVVAELPARELRFGWQTTLQVSPQTAARVVSALATPWKAWAPNPYPSAQQVIDTRFAPGQPHWDLPGESLRAWWPFLLYSVIFYGLFVRGALLLFSVWKTQSALRGLAFNHADANALWRRLTGPQITVRGGEAKLEDAPRYEPVPRIAPMAPAAPTEAVSPAGPATAAPVAPQVAAENCFAVIAEELTVDEPEIRDLARRRYGWNMSAMRTGKVDNRRASTDLYAEVSAAAPSLVSVLVVVPATRDPIVAVALFLRELITAGGGKPEVIVQLVGERKDGGFGPVDDARFEIWRRFRDIQRLRIGLER